MCVFVCCVGFASFDVVCDELHDCAWHFGLLQFLICMFIVSKVLLLSSVTVIVRAGGVIWVNPLICVCSTVTVECCVGVFAVMEGGRLFSRVFAIIERRDMVLYEVLLSMSLLWFGMRTMLATFYMCSIMLVLRAVFNMFVRNTIPRGPMWFRCMMYSLSGYRELLFLLCLLPLGSELWWV